MRSPLGPFLVITTLATTVALVLLLFVTLGARSEVEAVRGELDALRTELAEEPGGSDQDIVQRLDDLEAAIDNLVAASGGNGSPTVGTPTGEDLDGRIDEILARISALDDRIDEVCGNVPVC